MEDCPCPICGLQECEGEIEHPEIEREADNFHVDSAMEMESE